MNNTTIELITEVSTALASHESKDVARLNQRFVNGVYLVTNNHQGTSLHHDGMEVLWALEEELAK